MRSLDNASEPERNKNEICGFIDKKQALKWFSILDLKLLKTFGFELKEIEVKEITAIGKNRF